MAKNLQNETDEERMRRLDREACRGYASRHYNSSYASNLRNYKRDHYEPAVTTSRGVVPK